MLDSTTGSHNGRINHFILLLFRSKLLQNTTHLPFTCI